MVNPINWPTHTIEVISVQHFYDQLDHLENAVILDLCQSQTYAWSHIPGAVHLPISKIIRTEGYASGLAPSAQQLLTLARDFGLSPNRSVYIYDDEGGGWAGRMIWLLDILGITSVYYVNGGLRAWMLAGFPLESTKRKPVACDNFSADDYELNWFPNIELDEMRVLVASEDYSIWDARSFEEYAGLCQYAQKKGHMPGAKHYDWQSGMQLEQGSVIRPLDAIRAELQALGISKEKPVVTHCQTHHRSGFSYLLGRLLGFNIRAYAGSWSEWGNLPDTPCVTETIRLSD